MAPLGGPSPGTRPADAGEAEAELDGRALGARSVRGAAVTLGAQAIRFVLQFGSQVLLARLLAPGWACGRSWPCRRRTRR